MTLFDRDKWHEILFALKQNKLRTFFTAFGVFWGIFMLIIMLGSGRGLNNGVRQGMGDMATNAMFVWTQSTTMPYKGFQRGRRYNFTNEDTQAIRDNLPQAEYIAPRLQVFGGNENNNVVYGDRTASFSIQGDYPDYFKIDPVNLEQGRLINDLDIEDKRKVVVIGTRVKDELFDTDEDPIGKMIRIQGVYFKVVGVHSSKKSDRQGEQENSQIYMPFATMQQTYNFGNRVGWYSITAEKGYPASQLLDEVKALLKSRHAIHPDDERAIGAFNIETEYIKMQNLFMGIDALIWFVGIFTLIAGVIGISNIMLVVVKERTKEIGIQRALGATPLEVKSQIVIETVFLTTIAGYIGLTAGVGILELINWAIESSGATGQMFSHPEVDFNKAISALILLVVSGALAGLIPAQRAVSIKPIDALRDE